MLFRLGGDTVAEDDTEDDPEAVVFVVVDVVLLVVDPPIPGPLTSSFVTLIVFLVHLIL